MHSSQLLAVLVFIHAVVKEKPCLMSMLNLPLRYACSIMARPNYKKPLVCQEEWKGTRHHQIVETTISTGPSCFMIPRCQSCSQKSGPLVILTRGYRPPKSIWGLAYVLSIPHHEASKGLFHIRRHTIASREGKSKALVDQTIGPSISGSLFPQWPITCLWEACKRDMKAITLSCGCSHQVGSSGILTLNLEAPAIDRVHKLEDITTSCGIEFRKLTACRVKMYFLLSAPNLLPISCTGWPWFLAPWDREGKLLPNHLNICSHST